MYRVKPINKTARSIEQLDPGVKPTNGTANSIEQPDWELGL
jgi:hypothetical protein